MDDGVIQIHGKSYKTVALRVSEFREKHPISEAWGITTELIEINSEAVVVRASVVDANGAIVGSGLAEERRDASKINRTSALENCETSAIGRALAACGFAGTEYASANEVQGAIEQQDNLVESIRQRALLALEKQDWATIYELNKDELMAEAMKGVDSKKRSAIKKLDETRKQYIDSLNAMALKDDAEGVDELAAELSDAEKKCIFPALSIDTQDYLQKRKEAA